MTICPPCIGLPGSKLSFVATFGARLRGLLDEAPGLLSGDRELQHYRQRFAVPLCRGQCGLRPVQDVCADEAEGRRVLS